MIAAAKFHVEPRVSGGVKWVYMGEIRDYQPKTAVILGIGKVTRLAQEVTCSRSIHVGSDDQERWDASAMFLAETYVRMFHT